MTMTLIFRGGCQLYYCASDKDNNPPELDFQTIANCLTAGVSHGLFNYGVNAVMEIFELNEEQDGICEH